MPSAQINLQIHVLGRSNLHALEKYRVYIQIENNLAVDILSCLLYSYLWTVSDRYAGPWLSFSGCIDIPASAADLEKASVKKATKSDINVSLLEVVTNP